MGIPPSKLQRDTFQRLTLTGRSLWVPWNLLAAPVLVLGQGGDEKILIAPCWGLGFWFSLLMLLFGPNSVLLSDASRGYLYSRR